MNHANPTFGGPTMLTPEFLERCEGVVLERSRRHIAGFVFERGQEFQAATIEIGLLGPKGFEPLRCVQADQYSFNNFCDLRNYKTFFRGFYFTLSEPLADDDPRHLVARLASKGPWVPIGKGLVRAFLPIKLVAMDITNNCNLRCPFCITDYSDIRRTFNMEQSVYERLLELVPFVRDEGHFWLSCGNEPTLHPKFLDFIDLVPLAFRKKVAFCTNLARPLKDDYLERLANSGVFRISISMDSMSDPSFTLLRRGGRLRIFRDNIERFAKHLQASAAPPKIEVITMGFKSNYDEIPDMIRWTQENLNAFDHSVRYAWQAAHQDQAFMEREQLNHADWDRLEARLAREGLKYSLHPLPKDHEQVPLDYKVPIVPRGEQKAAPRPLDLSVRWDGSIEVNGFPFSGENQLAHKFGVFKAGDTNEHLIDYLSRF